MKGINNILGALAAASLLLFSVSALGQTQRGPYETNTVFDNTYIHIGVGVNATVMHPTMPKTWGGMGLATDISFGKWWTPAIGMNLGIHGLTNNSKEALDVQGIAAETPNGFHYIHGDLLWNISNSIAGYNPDRFWDFVPYVGFGFLDISTSRSILNPNAVHNTNFAASLGLKNILNIIDDVDVIVDLSAIVAKAGDYSTTGGRLALFPSATVGIAFNLGQQGFVRHKDIEPVIVPVPFTEGQYNDLSDKLAALEKENAQLKDKAAALENQLAPYRALTDGQTYLYKDGSFSAVDVKAGSPITLYFDCGATTLSAREKAHLEYFTDNVVNGDVQLSVNGYADKQTGSAKRNQQLSQQRVDHVVDLLKKAGASADKIEAVAHGATVELFGDAALNRVVTIEVK